MEVTRNLLYANCATTEAKKNVAGKVQMPTSAPVNVASVVH